MQATTITLLGELSSVIFNAFQHDKKTVNGKKPGIRQHSWRRQQHLQHDPNNNSTAAFKAMPGQGNKAAFREIPMLNMFLQRLQQHTNLATAAAILGTPAAAAAAAAAAVPPSAAAAMQQQQASPAHAKSPGKGFKGGKHKNGGKKQGSDTIFFC